MKSPNRSNLCNDSDRRLYSHDMSEWHNPDSASFSALAYEKRVDLILNAVKRFGATCKILDCGCAQGNISLLLAELGYCVVAMDLRLDFLKYALRKYEKGRLFPLCASAKELAFKRNSFEIIIMSEVIEHLAYPLEFLSMLKGYLREGGMLILSTPNGKHFQNKLPCFGDVHDWGPLLERECGPDGTEHLFLFSKKELATVLYKAGYTVYSHVLYNTFLITGRSFGFRRWGKMFPLFWRSAIERLLLRSGLGDFLAEGQFLIATI